MRGLRLLFVLSVSVGTCSAAEIQVARLPSSVLTKRLALAPQTNKDRASGLHELFVAAGCEELTLEDVRGSKEPNVVCVMPGQTEQLIVVGAHYDKVKAGAGVLDNWSGAALLPALYEGLKTVPRRFTFLFIGFADEEKGLIGSRSHARKLHKEQRGLTRAMINLDVIGGSPVAVWPHQADTGLLGWLASLGHDTGASFVGIDLQLVGDSDSSSYRARKIPTLTFHSVTQELWPYLHTDQDQLDKVDPKFYYDAYTLIIRYLALLDLVWEAAAEP